MMNMKMAPIPEEEGHTSGRQIRRKATRLIPRNPTAQIICFKFHPYFPFLFLYQVSNATAPSHASIQPNTFTHKSKTHTLTLRQRPAPYAPSGLIQPFIIQLGISLDATKPLWTWTATDIQIILCGTPTASFLDALAST